MARTIDLSGKVAIITGSTSGIGKATARKFLQAGAAVVINGRDETRGRRALTELTADIEGSADRCFFQPADVTVENQAAALVAAAINRFGRVDFLINNAGNAGHIRPFQELDVDEWFSSFAIKFWSKLYLIRHVIKPMIDQGGGAIVNLMSDAGRVGTPGESIISGAYGGLVAITKSLAQELARYKIRINNVSITLTGDTGIYDEVMSGEFSRRIFTKIEERIPLGLLMPDDVAEAVFFMASPLAGKITGQTLSVNGGMSYPS